MNQSPSGSDVAYQVAILLRRAVLAGRLKGSLDQSAYLLLRVLRDQGPLGVKELARHFHLDLSTVTRQALALERRGTSSGSWIPMIIAPAAFALQRRTSLSSRRSRERAKNFMNRSCRAGVLEIKPIWLAAWRVSTARSLFSFRPHRCLSQPTNRSCWSVRTAESP